MTDSSFKMFAAEPTPGHDPSRLIGGHAKSTSDLATTRSRDFLPAEEKKDHPPHSQHHTQQQEKTAPKVDAAATAKSGGEPRREHIRGPWRILRLLPRESRHIIHRMLDLNPKTRATMEQILEEGWVADTVICQQLENGVVIPAEDHEHVLEPHSSTPAASKQ